MYTDFSRLSFYGLAVHSSLNSDKWQRQGLAHLLMRHLIDTARSHGLRTMEGDILRNNNEMLRLVTKLGFSISHDRSDTDMEHVVLRM